MPGAGHAGVRPRVGFSPNRPHDDAGIRIDPPPSLAWPAGTMPPATAAADPPDEPPVEWLVRHGLWAGPWSTGSVLAFLPISGVLVLPRMIRPAAL